MSTENKAPMTDAEYAVAGSRCPYCYEPNAQTAGQIEVSGNVAWQPCHCPDCGKDWTDQFILTGYAPVE